MKSEWNLFRLVRTEIATTEEWNAYLKVKDATPPKPANQRQEDYYAINKEKWLEAASPEFRTKYEMEQTFIPKIRKLFTSEVWIGEGRNINNDWWDEISKLDWQSQPIDITENWLGNTITKFHDLRVWKYTITPQEELIGFIENCTSVLTPNRYSKDDIKALAAKELNRPIARSTFHRAWAKAKFADEWSKQGRKAGKDFNPNSMT
jgi:hypothetical protein